MGNNKLNDFTYIMRSDIAEPYCHWAEDKDAARHPALMSRRFMYRSVGCLIATLGLVTLVQMLLPSVPYCDVITKSALICLGLAIVSGLFLNRPFLLNCTNCGKEMKPVQVNPPKGTPSDLQGQYGRIYRRVLGEGCNQQHWVRIVQELRICAACNRYVVVQEAAHIVIGPTKQNVLEYEDRFNAARHAVEGKTFRLKKQRPNHSVHTTA